MLWIFWEWATTYAEYVAFATGVLCVWLYGRESMWAWPVGLVNVVFLIGVFYSVRLFADVFLNAIFFVLTCHGWWKWLFGGPEQTRLPMRRGLSFAYLSGLFFCIGALEGAFGWFFTSIGADLPYWDSLILVLSLVAQWLLNQKQLESWLFWIAVDLLAIGVYSYKDLQITAALYAVYLGLATHGYFSWRRKLRERDPLQPSEPAHLETA